MSEIEYHIVRLSCHVKKLKLNVKFPCSISFRLKYDQNALDSHHSYELQAGQCNPNEKLTLDTQIQVKDNKYDDSKATLIVMMTSANGKIPAGSVNLKIVQNKDLKGYELSEFGVQKCPDKSSKVQLSLKTQFIRSIKKQNPSKERTGMQVSIQRINSTYSPDKKMNSYLSKGQNQKKFGSTSKFSSKYLKRLEGNRSFHNRQQFRGDNSRVSSQYLQDKYHREENISQNSGGHYDRQKVGYERQISRLKSQIYGLRRDQKWDSEEQLTKYRHQIDLLTTELQTVKQKFKVLQKRDRENIHRIRDLQDDLEKTKHRQSQNQYLKNEALLTGQEKQKQVRDKYSQNKKLKEEIEEIKANLNVQDKKIEFKENAFKQQLKKISDKYHQSEAERQKVTVDLNNFLQEMEKNEKKNQLHIKQKDRAYLQEKNTLVKKIQYLNRRIEKLLQEKEDSGMNRDQLSQNIKFLTKKQKQVSEELQRNRIQIDSLTSELHKKNTYIKGIQRQLQEYKNSNEDLVVIKRKYIELVSQNNRNKETIDKETKSRMKLQEKVKKNEAYISQINTEKSSIGMKLAQVNRQVQAYKKSQQAKQRQIQSLTQAIQSANDRYNDLKGKMQNDRYRYEEENRNLSQEITYFLKTKQYLQTQLEEEKWKNSKSQENYEDLRDKHNMSNEQILKLNQSIINMQERIKKLVEQAKEQQSQIKLLKLDRESGQRKEKQLGDQIKEKVDTIFGLNKTIKEKEQQNYLINQKLKEKELYYTQKLKQKDNAFNSKVSTVSQSAKIIKQLQNKIDGLLKSIQKYQKQKLSKQEQNICLNDNINTLKEQLKRIQTQREQMAKANLLLDQQEAQNKNKIQELKQKNKKIATQVKTIKKEFDEYKEANVQAMTKLIQELNKEEDVNQQLLSSFPQLILNNLQIQAARNKKVMVSNFYDKIKELEESRSLIRAQLQKSKKNGQQRQIQLQQIIQVEKDKNRSLQKEISGEKSAMMDSTVRLQENILNLKSQVQKLNAQVKNHEEIKIQMHAQISGLEEMNAQYKEKIGGLQKEIQNYKKEDEKEKLSKDNEFTLIINEKKTIIDRLKQNISEYDKRNLQSEKNIMERDSHIRKLQAQLTSANYSKDKLQQKVTFAQAKLNEHLKNIGILEQSVKNYEKHIKQSSSAEENLRQENTNQKFKIQQLQLRVKKLSQQLEEKISENNKVTKELNEATQSLVQTDTVVKKLQQRLKMDSEKYKNQLKELQQRIIQLNSDIQLKTFLAQQNEAYLKNQKEINQELKVELGNRKEENMKLQNKQEQLKSQILFVHQNFESEESDKHTLIGEFEKQKQKIDELLTQAMSNQLTIENLTNREKELQRMKSELESREIKGDSKNKQLRDSINDLKKEISSKNVKEEQHKTKIRSLESLLAQRTYDLQASTHENKQANEILMDLQQMQKENEQLQEELTFLKQNMNEQMLSSNNEIIELTGLLAQKEEELNLKVVLVGQHEQKIRVLSQELKNCLQAWNNQKSAVEASQSQITTNKYKQFINEMDNRSQKLLQKSRRINKGKERQNYSEA